mmetsp:Transcript_47208/g.131302  ORF Transcript_47208/g.131302 Transcript_47208/m.131302 type:complete len:220 (+) Transcript_47208:137-796(+)
MRQPAGLLRAWGGRLGLGRLRALCLRLRGLALATCQIWGGCLALGVLRARRLRLVAGRQDPAEPVARRRVGQAEAPGDEEEERQQERLQQPVEEGHARGRRLLLLREARRECQRDAYVLVARLHGQGHTLRRFEAAAPRQGEGQQQAHHAGQRHREVELQALVPERVVAGSCCDAEDGEGQTSDVPERIELAPAARQCIAGDQANGHCDQGHADACYEH